MVDFKDFQKLRWYFQVLIVTSVCGAGLALLWNQYLSPIQDQIKSRNEEYLQLQATIAKSMKQAAEFEKLKKETEALQVQLDSLKRILPTDKETDQLLRQAQSSASISALRILRVTPRPVIDHEVYTEWPIDMEVIGTYHNLGGFLDRIRQLPRIVNISSMKLHGRDVGGDDAFTASVGVTYTATTFVYKDQAPSNTAPPAMPVK